jgi:hypothetical protein
VDALLARGGSIAPVQERLFAGAREMGRGYRAQFGVATMREALAVAKFLYRGLGIDLRPDGRGCLRMERCFFSSYYSPDICRIVSALDEGLFSGLTDGGRLCFTQRITEGSECCRADILGESPP